MSQNQLTGRRIRATMPGMDKPADITTLLKLLGDSTRLRILAILDGTELTVKELTEALQIGQSTLSTQLGQLKDARLVSFRKENQYVYYRLSTGDGDSFVDRLWQQVLDESRGADWFARDRRRLEDILQKRKEASLAFFGTLQAQNQTSPGQTWEGLARGLLELVRGQRIVDLGCGVGRLAALFAATGNKVTGVDNSAEQIQAARRLHKDQTGLQFTRAAMEDTGLPGESWDIAVISHSLHHAARPQACLQEAWRLLVPGGKLLILDLNRHHEDWIKDRFADFWLGFDHRELEGLMADCGFVDIASQIAGPDPDFPSLEPIILCGQRPR